LTQDFFRDSHLDSLLVFNDYLHGINFLLYTSTPRREPHHFDKQSFAFGCKTDTNITVMSNVSLTKFELSTGFVLFASLI